MQALVIFLLVVAAVVFGASIAAVSKAFPWWRVLVSIGLLAFVLSVLLPAIAALT